MTLPLGVITLEEVNLEIGSPATATITLNDTAVRRLAATDTLSPSSPYLTDTTQISLNDLKGKQAKIFASGGAQSDEDGYRVHVFTGPGTFVVNYAFPSSTVQYLVVAGGGGGGGGVQNPFGANGGGGGAGGVRTGDGFPITTGNYSITVGAGGGAASGNGSNSTFSTITSTGGGGGATLTSNFSGIDGKPGGSGGGGRSNLPAGSGNTPPTSPPQGNPGGFGGSGGAGGGGGAGGAGFQSGPIRPPTLPPIFPPAFIPPAEQQPINKGGDGGDGIEIPWVPPAYAPPLRGRYFGGGGGGGAGTGAYQIGVGGLGGGGVGQQNRVPNGKPESLGIDRTAASAGLANSGGGGGGSGIAGPNPFQDPKPVTGAAGGSGIVIIRYPIA